MPALAAGAESVSSVASDSLAEAAAVGSLPSSGVWASLGRAVGAHSDAAAAVTVPQRKRQCKVNGMDAHDYWVLIRSL